MRLAGVILWVIGAALAAYAMLVFDPSVDGGPYFGGRVINNGLQQQQMMMLMVGCVMFAVGAIIHAGSYYFTSNHSTLTAMDSGPGTTLEKQPASITRLAYARSLGVSEDAHGYYYSGLAFASIEDAIFAARQGFELIPEVEPEHQSKSD